MSDRSLRGSHDLSVEFEKAFLPVTGYKTKIARLFSKYLSCHTDWAVGNNTYECTCRLLWKCQLLPKATRKKFTSLNCLPWIVFAVCAECQIVTCSCTQRQTSKAHCKLEKGEIFRDLDDGWCRTCLKLTVRTVRLKMLTGPVRLGNVLYLQTWRIECNFEVEKWEAVRDKILR
jgi:hypothetical protein